MKIVIVGGGTAGWLSALYMCRYNQSNLNEIVVIESSKIATIGAGEGSTGILPRTIQNNFTNMGINEIDFLYNTEATQKLGINLKDWNRVGTQFYSPIQPTESALGSVDFELLISMVMGDYCDSSSAGYLQKNGYSAYTNNKTNFTAGSSYHFDANKVGEYFKSIALKNGVKCIDTEIEALNINSLSGELESVNTTIGNVTGDFWIDCSGFAKVLIGPMGGGWKSYSEYLLVNKAIPYIHQFEKDEDIRLETLSWAMPNGWMWQIPTQKRYGCGYVYSDMFTNYDSALDELIKTTGRNIEPLRDLKFDCGRLENFWVKNTVAIGLSAGFVEPLEATSIHTTVVQLDLLLSTGLNFQTNKNDIIYQTNIDKYNNHFRKMFDDVKDLIQIHYITDREDTQFWKYCKYEMKKTDKVKEILDICKYRSPNGQDFDMYHGGLGWGVWCWTVIGLGHLNKDIAKKTLESFGNIERNFKPYYQNIKNRNSLNIVKAMKSKDFMRALINKKLK